MNSEKDITSFMVKLKRVITYKWLTKSFCKINDFDDNRIKME